MPLYLVLIPAIALGVVYGWSRLFKHVGWSPWLAVLMLVPLLNMLMLVNLGLGREPFHPFASTGRNAA